MRLSDPDPVGFLSGLAFLGFAFCLVVGSGMEMHVEHDNEHFWAVVIGALFALGGVVQIGISMWPSGEVKVWKDRPSSHQEPPDAGLD